MILFFIAFIICSFFITILGLWFYKDAKKHSAISSQLFFNLSLSHFIWIISGGLWLAGAGYFPVLVTLAAGWIFYFVFVYFAYENRNSFSLFFKSLEGYKKHAKKIEEKRKDLFDVIYKSMGPAAVVDKNLNYVLVNEDWFKTFQLKSSGFKNPQSLEGVSHLESFIIKNHKRNKTQEKELKKLHQRCLKERQPIERFNRTVTIKEGGYPQKHILDWKLIPVNGNKMLISIKIKTQEAQALKKLEAKNKDYKDLIHKVMEDPYKASQWATHELLKNE